MSPRPRGAIAALLIVLLLAACPAGEPRIDIGMTDSTFVHTMVRLRKVDQDSTLDSLARDSARRMVLRTEKVSPERMEAAAKALAEQPTRAEKVWKTIEDQLIKSQRATGR
jgi:hypothetical protein